MTIFTFHLTRHKFIKVRIINSIIQLMMHYCQPPCCEVVGHACLTLTIILTDVSTCMMYTVHKSSNMSLQTLWRLSLVLKSISAKMHSG